MTQKKSKISRLIAREIKRQQEGLVMIASENYAPQEVLEAIGSPLTNKYSEGYPGRRYYTGNEIIDEIEIEAQRLALKIFGLSEKNWRANVQPHSGSSANLAVYLGLLQPGEKILGMDLGAGGHLTHGSPVNFSGKLFQFNHYQVDQKNQRLDYQKIAAAARKYRPKMIVAGATAYPRKINFKKFKEIAEEVKAFLVADIAHIAGLVTAKVHPSPFPHADIVTTTTHKTLRGPRSAIIICRKEFEKQINRAVFPGLQGGPLDQMTAAKAVCFRLALTEKFRQDQRQTVKNAKALAAALKAEGLKLISGGTDNHLILLNCQPLKISGKQGAEALAEAKIYANANMIPYDPAKPLNPSGIRIGTPAVTSRGMTEAEMEQIAGWFKKILLKPNSTALKRKISREVKKLTERFPLSYG